jgi:integrase/recombinase XerD
LEPFRGGFREALVWEGYAPGRVGLHLALLSQLSVWLGERGIVVEGLTTEVVEEFFEGRRVRYSWLKTSRSLEPLLRYLRAAGVTVTAEDKRERTALEDLLERYRLYLVHERGLARASIEMYLRRAAVFLEVLQCGGVEALQELDAASVVDFVRREVKVLSVPSASCLLNALRSFLTFLYVKGLVAGPLQNAVPGVARWRQTTIPRAVSPEVAGAVLASCDTATAVGRRDLAILTVLLRLGLRAGELAALCLDDIDWRAGEMLVHGKGRRVEVVPMPTDVGEAIVAYLTDGRPQMRERGLFLAVVAPYARLSRYGVRSVVYHACDRAGVDRIGPHRLRSTAATRTLRAGASLPEVAELLRQRSLEVTSLYAKVDYEQLASVAQPWPGGGA